MNERHTHTATIVHSINTLCVCLLWVILGGIIFFWINHLKTDAIDLIKFNSMNGLNCISVASNRSTVHFSSKILNIPVFWNSIYSPTVLHHKNDIIECFLRIESIAIVKHSSSFPFRVYETTKNFHIELFPMVLQHIFEYLGRNWAPVCIVCTSTCTWICRLYCMFSWARITYFP